MIANKLNSNSTIGIISPASPCDLDKLESSIRYIENLGFNIKKGKHIYDKWGYLCGSDIDRSSDLTNMFLDDSVDMILCIRGGYGTMRILPYIDFDLIKSHPKIFAGFSDITTLLNYISLKCNLTTFHSPMLTSNFNDKYTFKSFFNTLKFGNSPYIIENPPNIKVKALTDKKIEGQLVGGNLSLISSTIGTAYEIDTKDKILFIEEVGEPCYKIDRMLTQLDLSGKLNCCKGFILGQFTNCTYSKGQNRIILKDIIKDKILKFKKPTLINFMTGHSYPNLTLPIGAKIKLNCPKKYIKVIEPVVK